MRENKEALTFLPRPPENYLNTTSLRNVPMATTGINHVPIATAPSNTATITLAPNEAMPNARPATTAIVKMITVAVTMLVPP